MIISRRITNKVYILQQCHTIYKQKYLAMTKTVVRQCIMYNYVATHMLYSAVTANFAALVVSPRHRRHSLEDDLPDQYSHSHVK